MFNDLFLVDLAFSRVKEIGLKVFGIGCLSTLTRFSFLFTFLPSSFDQNVNNLAHEVS